MPSEQDGVMVILSSPSGAGKTTLVNLLSNLDITFKNEEGELEGEINYEKLWNEAVEKELNW